MTASTESIAGLRTADMLAFVAVCRCGSMAAAARELRVTTSFVSKAISRLEEHVGAALIGRGSSGITILDEGVRVLRRIERVVADLQELSARNGAERVLTVAAPSYLCSFLVPRIAAACAPMRIRALEMPPALLRIHAGDGYLDVLLSLGQFPLPPSWTREIAGSVRRGLFASPALAARLGSSPLEVDRLRQVPFISPVYATDGRFIPVDDDCPLARTDRTLGDEVSTIGVGLELARRTEQLIFGPVIAAQPYLDRGELVELSVAGWRSAEELSVSYYSERVLDSERRLIGELVQTALATLGEPC
jgi:DNA-binding transcriptional LysR family regulator